MAKINSVKEILTHEFLTDWLSTALYGSSWFDCATHKDTSDEVYEKAKKENDTREDVWADVLLNGGALNVIDMEEADGSGEGEYKMTLEDIEEAIPLFTLNHPSEWASIMDETGDIYDSDALLQFVIFGDVQYG